MNSNTIPKSLGLISRLVSKAKVIYIGLIIISLFFTLLITNITIDTDPENMLGSSDPTRQFHQQVKNEFKLNDLIVIGIVDNNGIFSIDTLSDVKTLTDAVKMIDGVIANDVYSISSIDNISQQGSGTLRFDWMMPSAPQDLNEVEVLQQQLRRLPFVMNTLISADEKAATIYVPIKNKDQSYLIAEKIRKIVTKLSSSAQFHITGLPVAEDTFGVEMFVQMGISAPLAGIVIYLLLLYFFRSPVLVTAPMIVAMATVIITMGLMIGLGFTVHIMSSMIPIFLMPIAVVDSVHLMSEFADKYQREKTAAQVIAEVTQELFKPMLFTSITSSVGFFSLALTPIPPVQVFGVFVGFGILLAFILTIIFIPVYVSRMKPAQLIRLQSKQSNYSDNQMHARDRADLGWLVRWLPGIGRFSIAARKPIIVLFMLAMVVAYFGIRQIVVNDNPVRWFKQDHSIRIADKVLNQHFAGTYDAYMVFSSSQEAILLKQWKKRIAEIATLSKPNETLASTSEIFTLFKIIEQTNQFSKITAVVQELEDLLFTATMDHQLLLQSLLDETDILVSRAQLFTQPEVLSYIEHLQQQLNIAGLIGKSTSVVELVNTVNRELQGGEHQNYRLPETQSGVAQTLLQFQSSHRPQDLSHFITPDNRRALIWLQLSSGDNRDMNRVVKRVEEYIVQNPLPTGVQLQWAGKTYLNSVWQEKMVNGMFNSLIGSFVVVFVMMVLLFRSIIFGFLAMLPLTITISIMYAVVGWSGTFYDMPIAVLSALTLGLSVDFAIHFLQRVRTEYAKHGRWPEALAIMFNEPARAISRNALVIAIGFTPLLFAPLVPYITVGAFLASIMLLSALVTIVLLPAVLVTLKRWVFRES